MMGLQARLAPAGKFNAVIDIKMQLYRPPSCSVICAALSR